MAETRVEASDNAIPDLKAQLVSGQGEHVEQIAAEVEVNEHQQTVFGAIKHRPWAFAWCIYAIWVLLLTSYDNQAGGIVVSIPQFRMDFGSAYAGDYVLPAKWQSAYSGAPVAS